MKPIVRLALVLTAMAVGLGALACGSDETEEPADGAAAPAAPTAPAPANAPSVSPDEPLRYSLETEEGEQLEAQIGGDVALPSDFPSDVPQYPGGRATASVSVGAGGLVVRVETADDEEIVYSYYRDNLERQGWDIANEASFQGQRLIEATKDERKASIGVGAVEGTTQVNIAVMGTR